MDCILLNRTFVIQKLLTKSNLKMQRIRKIFLDSEQNVAGAKVYAQTYRISLFAYKLHKTLRQLGSSFACSFGLDLSFIS